MRFGISEIDHVVSVVEDAGRAGDLLADVGFTVTPISLLENIGVANRLVLLEPPSPGAASFVEVMGVTNRAAVPAAFRGHVLGKSGYRWIVTSGTHARATHAALVAHGYTFAPPVSVDRRWVLPDGEVLPVGFDVLLPIEAPLPFNFCAYRTPEHYARPAFLDHPNGAYRLTGILCQAESPDDFVAYFEQLFGVIRRTAGVGLCSVSPGRVELLVGNARTWRRVIGDELEPAMTGSCRVLGCRIEVRALAETRSFLADRGIPGRDCELGLAIASPVRDGTLFVFH